MRYTSDGSDDTSALLRPVLSVTMNVSEVSGTQGEKRDSDLSGYSSVSAATACCGA